MRTVPWALTSLRACGCAPSHHTVTSLNHGRAKKSHGPSEAFSDTFWALLSVAVPLQGAVEQWCIWIPSLPTRDRPHHEKKTFCLFSVKSIITPLSFFFARLPASKSCPSLGLSDGKDKTRQSIQFVSASPHQNFHFAVSLPFIEVQIPLLLCYPIQLWSEVTTALAEHRPLHSVMKQESYWMRTLTKRGIN